MKHIAAYVLLVLGGNATPSAEDVTNLLTKIGAEVDETKITTLLSDLEGKDIHELLAKGDADLKSVVGVSSGAAGIYFRLYFTIFPC
jgi:large subunit ribosomal protein LP2